MSVPDPDLVASVGAFFEVQLLVVGLRPMMATDDQFHLHWSSGSEPWLVTYRDAKSLEEADLLRESILIHCESLDSIYDHEWDPLAFRTNVVWLMPGSQVGTFESLPLRLDSNFLVYDDDDAGDGTVGIREAYAVKGGRTIFNHFGWWSAERGLEVAEPAVWERRTDFQGANLINTVLSWSPMIMVDPETKETSGLFSSVFNLLQSKLNFRYVNKT